MKDDPMMRREIDKGTNPTPVQMPSESAFKQQLLLEAVQHPAALLPLAACIMSVVYLLLLSPRFGGQFLVTSLLIGSGFMATASLAWLFLTRYPEEHARKIRESMKVHDLDRDRSEKAAANELRETLQDGFADIDSVEGAKTLNRIGDEYERLLMALDTTVEISSILLPNLSTLADETYRRGLSVLSDALELMKTTRPTDRERIEEEVAGLEIEVDASATNDHGEEWHAIKEETLASHRKRLYMLDRLQLRTDQLLHQANRCEASLHGARIELAAIKAGMSETQVDSVIGALQSTIHQAKEVQDELKRQGYWA